jgi:hypothetical protein
MVLVAPSTLVAAPVRTAMPYGLGSVLNWRTGDRFESGVTWQSVTCDPAGGRGGPHCDPADVIGLPKVFDGERLIAEATPFVVYGHDSCNIIGTSFEESQQYATDHLLAREEARAEQALWTGDLGNIPNFVGANGFPAPVTAGSHATAPAALAAVEQGIAEEYGSLGTIHLSRRTASLLRDYLEASNGRLYTRLGTPVVAGAGYPDVQEIVGTPALVGWRGEAFTSSNRPGDLLDRAQNIIYAVAEREYVIGFDPCPVVKATYTGVETL